MRFDINNFTQELHRDFEEFLTIEEAKSLMALNEDYDKDSPLSTRKNLFLTYVSFVGEKSSGEVINYHQKIEKGINIWIADNLKGKSSIFKIIKYALTGNNAIKQDIKKWIKHIFLNFNINSQDYTIYLNLEKRLNGYLLNGTFKTIDEIKNNQQKYIIFAKSESEYEEEIEKFFFRQFSYYALKWTQKSSSKDNNDLLESSASWKTYFKSIFLESKDFNSFYGDQEKKVFQMMLGLELTYPINQLTVKKDFLNNKKAKEQASLNQESQDKLDEKSRLQGELLNINKKIEEIASQKSEKINLAKLYSDYNLISKKIEIENQSRFSNETELKKQRELLNCIDLKISANNAEIKRMENEKNKNTRKTLDLQEYMDIGIFFSNLDIKHCPSCNHEVSKTKQEKHKCVLCNENIGNHEVDDKKEIYIEKIERLKKENTNFSSDIKLLVLDNEKNNSKRLDFLSKISDCENNIRDININIQQLTKQLTDVESTINIEKEKINPNDNESESLISQRAIINYQISELEKSTASSSNTINYDKQIEFLTKAIKKLNVERYKRSKKILKNLEDLMLSEIHKFGLKSISKIEIDDEFNIRYNQNGGFIKFSDIAEGEQLRVKIAFYLSLIQLDIEHNFGRHTRFLIIDSPNKEEGDANYLEGLTSVLQNIQKDFGEQLQILIGTAERGFVNIVNNQYITPENSYVF